MYQCNRCHKTYQDEQSPGVEVIFGKPYCISCGEQLTVVDETSPSPVEKKRINGMMPTMVSNSDNRVSSTSNSNNTSITNIYKGEEHEKIETRYGVYKKEDVSLCKSCREYVPKNYFVSDTGVCQDCMVKIQIEEGDGALGEGLYEEAKECYEKILRNTYGNEERRHELLYKLGRCYFELKEGKTAVGYFAKTRNKFADSIYYLGRCSEIGLGKEKNLEVALKYYKEAASKGSQLARNELDRIEQEGIEEERNELEEAENELLVKDVEDQVVSEEVIDSPTNEGGEDSFIVDEENNHSTSEEESASEINDDSGKSEIAEDNDSVETQVSTQPTTSTNTVEKPLEVNTIPNPIPQRDEMISSRDIIGEEGFMKKNIKFFIGICVLVVLAVLYFVFSNKNNEIEKIVLNSTEKSMLVGSEDTLIATCFPEAADKLIGWRSSDNHIATVQDGIVTAHSTGEVVISVFSLNNEDISANCNITIAPEPKKEERIERKSKKGEDLNENVSASNDHSLNSVDLGYAKFEGSIKNGKPDGAGILTFKQHHLAGRDFVSGEEIYAEPGERIDGNFSNGYLQIGTLYKSDGNVKKIKY